MAYPIEMKVAAAGSAAYSTTPNQRSSGFRSVHVAVIVVGCPVVTPAESGSYVTLPESMRGTTKFARWYVVEPPGVANPLT